MAVWPRYQQRKDRQCSDGAGRLGGRAKSYQAKQDIISRLAQSDPGNAGWQRDLSVSYEKVGDAGAAQGDLADALKSYRDSLAIRERLAQSDPGNAGWQHDLSVSYDKVGEVQTAQGDLAGALKSYRDSLAINQHLAALDRSNTQWQSELQWVIEQDRRPGLRFHLGARFRNSFGSRRPSHLTRA